jgi:hypothetical protein
MMAIAVPVAGTALSVSTFGKPVADAINAAPGSEIVYAQITAPVSITATTAAGAQAIIIMGDRTWDGTPFMVQFYTPNAQTPASAGGQILVNLWDNNTDLGYLAQLINPAAATFGMALNGVRKITPTAGTHNYSVRAWVSPSGTGGVSAGNGTINNLAPAFLRFTRV